MTPADFLSAMKLPEPLRQRILSRVSSLASEKHGSTTSSSNQNNKFVLYLPTVVVRKRHNPGFTFACHIANNFNVPLVVLYTILDDDHLSQRPLTGKVANASICMTSRRLAFIVEALQSATTEWEAHGAGVAIRIHGPGAKAPDHLTLANRALAVVTDEPFVEPYTSFVQKVVRACQSQATKVPCYSVDGSTTVPPNAVLKLHRSDPEGNLFFGGAPVKAWMWENSTRSQRKVHVHNTTQQGHLDAPDLRVTLPANFFRECDDTSSHSKLVSAMPSGWKQAEMVGLFSVSELSAIANVKSWAATSWEGADTSVPPCPQTHGSKEEALKRWRSFLHNGGLKEYARRRNQIVQPHAVSRISCYLNMGVLSIFDVVHDVWQKQATEKGYSNGCNKFLDEVVKWREIGYVWGFSSPSFKSEESIPAWARSYLQGMRGVAGNGDGAPYSYQQLESATTQDDKWNSMQNYLIETGELHNNARMTWGKTVVHWQASKYSPADVLEQLCCLNDRFALDGLSPPSYAGLLWCFGWGDKAGKSVSTKWAHRYRSGPVGFNRAKELLFQGATDEDPELDGRPSKKPRTSAQTNDSKQKSILAFVSPVSLVG